MPRQVFVFDNPERYSSLEVLVGANYTGSHAVTIGGTPSPAPITPSSGAATSPPAQVKSNFSAASGDCGP